MQLFEFEGSVPRVHPGAYVAPTATLIGDVTIEEGASIWFGGVLRGDVCAIVIGKFSNVQDNSVIHSQEGHTFVMGAHSTIAHGCIVHGDSIGDHTVIGNGAVLSSHSTVGSNSVVAAGSLVPPRMAIPDGVIAMGTPARVRGPVVIGTKAHELTTSNAAAYVDLSARYQQAMRRVEPPSDR